MSRSHLRHGNLLTYLLTVDMALFACRGFLCRIIIISAVHMTSVTYVLSLPLKRRLQTTFCSLLLPHPCVLSPRELHGDGYLSPTPISHPFPSNLSPSSTVPICTHPHPFPLTIIPIPNHSR